MIYSVHQIIQRKHKGPREDLTDFKSSSTFFFFSFIELRLKRFKHFFISKF